jgi:hypothetical protein
MNKYGLFPFAVFLGSFLLFQIQPLIGKYFLPWFGGSPAVWMVCLMFFQVLLLGGYAYAHLLQRWSSRCQVMIHCGLLLTALLGGIGLYFLWGSPILPPLDWHPGDASSPTGDLLILLLISIGLAYFLLSTSASLLQAWFHRAEPERSPYVFYVVSNAASLLALISYPLLIEPVFTIKTQAVLWCGGFTLFAVLCGLTARRVWPAEIPQENPADRPADKAPTPPPGWQQVGWWLALSAVGVLALMATTNKMTQDIPPVPFLLILPLALYLLTYIIGFMDRGHRRKDVCTIFAIIGIAAACYLFFQPFLSMRIQIAGYSVSLFFVCLFCHRTLYLWKPHARHLTRFYLSIACGGALAGLFASAAAPQLFDTYLEYPLCLVLVSLLAVITVYSNRQHMLYKGRHFLWLLTPLVIGLFWGYNHISQKGAIYRDRNFFGSIRVKETAYSGTGSPMYGLLHGNTFHGIQIADPDLRFRPTTYYTEGTGVGRAILHHPKRVAEAPMHVGVVGLGIGTLAAYGRPDDTYRFYEIDPAVLALAENSPWFTYLRDTACHTETVLGDARIQLEQELAQGDAHQFDVLVLDAFSGDSVPAHLLTREAFALYLEHLAEDGLLAVHISSRFINLQPVLQAVRLHFGLHGQTVHGEFGKLGDSSFWVILAHRKELLEPIKGAPLAGRSVVWTDDFSNLLSTLK